MSTPLTRRTWAPFRKASGWRHRTLLLQIRASPLARPPSQTNSSLAHIAVHRRPVGTLRETTLLGPETGHAVQRDSRETQGGQRAPLANNPTPDNWISLHHLGAAAQGRLPLVTLLTVQLKSEFAIYHSTDGSTARVELERKKHLETTSAAMQAKKKRSCGGEDHPRRWQAGGGPVCLAQGHWGDGVTANNSGWALLAKSSL